MGYTTPFRVSLRENKGKYPILLYRLKVKIKKKAKKRKIFEKRLDI